MEQVRQVWAPLAEHISKVVERAHNLPVDQLRFVAAFACLAFLLVLVAWVTTLRKLRKVRAMLVEAQAQSEELQVKYDAEARWRTATERVQAAKAERIVPAPSASPNPEPAQERAGVVASASDRGQEMNETGPSRRANTLRVLTLIMSVLALVGWGAFAYAAKSSATAQQQLREEVAHLKAAQDQLLAERDQAKAQVAAVQQELAVLQKRREERPEAGGGPPPATLGKPVRSPEQIKRESR